MYDNQHKDLVEIAAQIGSIADMPHRAIADMVEKFDPHQDLNEITVGELLSMAKTAEIKTIEKNAYQRGVQDSWKAVNKGIISGNLPGNGIDKTAQRNGMILASNAISDLMVVNGIDFNGMEFKRYKEAICQEV